ncbi:uncharacterized protein [Centruroides vittatus]|uniref:uncharacterized protein n=1 Tax=Centruroides vittatus TaxID=120091 RepID=UPI00350ED5C1
MSRCQLPFMAVPKWFPLMIGSFLHIVVLAVEIRRFSVPRYVENGTEDSVILDCEYVYNENDIRLVVKWFFNENLEPVYQWIPELKIRHTSGILQDRLDLNFSVNTVDAYSRYRALKVLDPTTELSGKYTCLVTSLAGQDSREQNMTVYVPAKHMELTYSRTVKSINVSCQASGMFPKPKLLLYKMPPYLSSPAVVQDVRTAVSMDNVTYDVQLHRSFGYTELSIDDATTFECVVEIPGTNYNKRKSIVYYTNLSNKSYRNEAWYIRHISLMTLLTAGALSNKIL